MKTEKEDCIIYDVCEHTVYQSGNNFLDTSAYKTIKINLCDSEVYTEYIYLEMQGEEDKAVCDATPDLRIHREDVPRLIFALQWMIAGPLGRIAIERDIETYEASHAT
jgi:hypothetical protein